MDTTSDFDEDIAAINAMEREIVEHEDCAAALRRLARVERDFIHWLEAHYVDLNDDGRQLLIRILNELELAK